MDIVLAAAAAAGLVLLALAFLRGILESTRRRRTPAGTAGSPGGRSCPLCSSRLGPGERVKSDIYPGAGDRIMRIFGCPHCWPPVSATPRTCPVCLREVPWEGWAVARYFERPGRRHVHVLGCTGCRDSRRK